MKEMPGGEHSVNDLHALAQEIADRYAAIPEVEAVAMAGSRALGAADADSDIDLYVYYPHYPDGVPVAARAAIAAARSVEPEIDNQFHGPEDAWRETASGVSVDVMFWHVPWIEDQLDRVLRRHEASLGYSTCFWHTVRVSRVLFDRRGWFHSLKDKAEQPYPEALRRAIVAMNHPLLRRTAWSYRRQIETAVKRGDLVSVQHRVTALLAGYFDILFAVNRLPHPGEKRLLAYAAAHCSMLPADLERRVTALIESAAIERTAILDRVDTLVDGLDRLLQAEMLIE